MARSEAGKTKGSQLHDDEGRRQDGAPPDPQRGGPAGSHPGFHLEFADPEVALGQPQRQKYFRATEAFEALLAQAKADQIAAHATLWIRPDGQIGWTFHSGDRNKAEFIGGLTCMVHAITSGAINGVPVIPMPENATRN